MFSGSMFGDRQLVWKRCEWCST